MGKSADDNVAAEPQKRVNPVRNAQIRNSFTYHRPYGTQVVRYQRLRDKACELALLIAELVPDGRYQALALTQL